MKTEKSSSTVSQNTCLFCNKSALQHFLIQFFLMLFLLNVISNYTQINKSSKYGVTLQISYKGTKTII